MNKEAKTIIEAIDDKKGKNIVSIDLSGVDGAICETFVICNADSTTQVSAIADGIDEKMEKELNDNPIRVQGKENGIWVIMDYGNVIVHIFETSTRDFYRLEQLWQDQPTTCHSTDN